MKIKSKLDLMADKIIAMKLINPYTQCDVDYDDIMAYHDDCVHMGQKATIEGFKEWLKETQFM